MKPQATIPWDAIGAVLTFLAAVITIFCWFYDRKIKNIREQLEDSEDRRQLKSQMIPDRDTFARYTASINQFDEWSHNVFGRPFGLKACGVNFSISLAYPIFLFMISWCLGASGSIGGIKLLPNIPGSTRIFASTIFFSALFGIAALSQNKSIYKLANKHLLQAIKFATGNRWPRLRNALYKVIRLSDGKVFVSSVATSVFMAYCGIFVGAILALPLAAVPFIVSHKRPGERYDGHVKTYEALGVGSTRNTRKMRIFSILCGMALSYLILCYSAATEANRELIGENYGRQFFIFLFILPAINSIADWTSWSVSRKLLFSLYSAPRGIMNLRHALLVTVLNVAVSIACLIGIAISSACLFELINNYLWEPPFTWRQYVSTAISHPVPGGILLSGILLTTVVPTFIQIWFACLAIASAPSPSSDSIASRLTFVLSTGEKQLLANDIFWKQLVPLHRDYDSLTG